MLFLALTALAIADSHPASAQTSEAVTQGDDSAVTAAPPSNALQLPTPPSDFTFKKIAPPEPGTSRRITIQIAPQPDPPPAATPAEEESPAVQPPPEPETITQFWRALGTGRTEAGPARLLEAMAWFDTADPPPASPPLVDLASLADQYGREMLTLSVGTQVSPALALAVVWTESSGRFDVVSPKGAQGLMQLIPATAERFEVKDPFNASQNLRGGIAYLNWLLERFDGDPILALAGYNAGEGAVDRAEDGAGGVPAIPETREYVVKVLSAWRVARGLCLTPPQLASDGCVFAPIAAN